ncbi:MAG: nickel uptake transporter family protein [Sphingobium sp.]|nr:nickel uptake transporter family protein [Sphingobium sp.]
MKRLSLALVALVSLSCVAQAHEIWVERDGTGPARIYLGEPGEALPEGGDPEFEKLKAPKLMPASQAAQVRKAGYIEVAAPAGDVRVIDDTVFEPWGEEGKKEGVIYYARAGRAEAKAGLPLEIVPTAAHADSFTLLREGKPVPATKLTVISPDKWTKAFTTDAQGRVALPLKDKGRYILSATQEEKGDFSLANQKVATLYHMATLTFLND